MDLFYLVCAIVSVLFVLGRWLKFATTRRAANAGTERTRPISPEEMTELKAEIRKATAIRFDVSPARLGSAVRLVEDLRIPRGELDEFIEDLSERLGLRLLGRTRDVETFDELLSLFIPA